MIYLHLSRILIQKQKLKPIYANQFGSNPLFYNPKGLWYSCGNEWIIKNKLNIEGKFLYSLDFSKLNILKISTLDALDEFNKTYYNAKFKNISNIINWDKVYKKYDGLQICPYLIKNSNMKFIHFGDLISFDDKIIINNIIVNKLKNIQHTNDIEKFDNIQKLKQFLTQIQKGIITEKEIYRLWCVGWEVGSGVIWKNYKKLKLEEIPNYSNANVITRRQSKTSKHSSKHSSTPKKTNKTKKTITK